MAKVKKFKTIDQLLNASDAGKLDLQECRVMIDNDVTHFYLVGEDEWGEDDVEILRVHPSDLVSQLLDRVGLRNEPA